MEPNAQQRTILIVEDDDSLLDAIEHEFTARGFTVLLAKDVDKAMLEVERKQSIHVIWLDHYLLGRANGLDFVARIKNHEQWKKIPIFVVSNNSGPSSIQSYIRLGVNQYYTKADYDLGQIVGDIERTLREPGTA